MDANGRQFFQMAFVKSFVLLASLSTQSLNQFADKVSQAEALSAEIACIHRGLAPDSIPRFDQRSSLPGTKRKGKLAGMSRF
jgi:hypothetical protein